MEVGQISKRAQEMWYDILTGLKEIDPSPEDQIVPIEITLMQEVNSHLTLPEQDEKTHRMFEIFANQKFDETFHVKRVNLLTLTWIISNFIRGNNKRLLDIMVSLFVLPFVFPIMLITAIAIKLESPGPVFFRQERVGKWGKHFTCYKFRSMYIDAEKRKAELMHLNEADEIVFKIVNDPRMTRVGRIIRKLSIDEIPQIFNVLDGSMSLVGPRPPVPVEVENYKYDHLRRLQAIPGITGLQQVSGRSDVSFNRWIELDVQYIQEQSLLKDIQILLKTIPAVITGKGAY